MPTLIERYMEFRPKNVKQWTIVHLYSDGSSSTLRYFHRQSAARKLKQLGGKVIIGLCGYHAA